MLSLNRRQRIGLSLVEIIMAVGFLAVFTTGLLAIATKGFDLSEQQIDIASAYQYGESLIEDYTIKSRGTTGWHQMPNIVDPQFAFSRDSTGAPVEDRRFVYTTQVEDLTPDLRFVTVVIYVADDSSTATIDTDAPRSGELLRFSNMLKKEAADA